jgi:hypothetical protein
MTSIHPTRSNQRDVFADPIKTQFSITRQPGQPSLHDHQHDQSLRTNLLLGLEVVKEDGALLGLLTPVLDDNARAVNDLAGVTLTVKGACNDY